MSEFSERDLEKLIKQLGDLDAVPEEVAARMDATVERLAASDMAKKRARSASTSWVLAAGVTLVFGLGVVLTVDSSYIGGNSDKSISTSSQKEQDDILTSSEDEPIVTTSPVPRYTSDLDYVEKIFFEGLPFLPPREYGGLSKLSPRKIACLSTLGLDETVSLLDEARYGDREVTAVWSAITGNSWQVFIIDDDCQGIAELFIDNRE